MSRTWDLLVVGGGTAGIVCAKTAAGLGARVLLVERARTGGDCLWTGCVPSKALLAAAAVAASARGGRRLGIGVDGLSVDFAAVMRHVHGAIATIEPQDSPAALERAGVDVRVGDLTLTGPRSAVVDGQPLWFAQAVVCTGSSPVLPTVPGLAEARPLTSDSVWDLTELPARLAVLGGGSIGCELGQAFARLGSEVTLVEGAPRLLSREDRRAAELVTEALRHDGVMVRTGAAVVEVKSVDDAGLLLLDDGTQVEFDRLLVSAGRRPTTKGLGLHLAGVDLDDHGYVRVDEQLRTSNPRVWAAGDVTGLPQFTHTAGVNGSLAATNAVLGLRRRVDAVVPRVTYTDPEVAAVGAASDDAPADHHVVVRDHQEVDRAIAEGQVRGVTKLVVDGGGRLVGATVVGPRAGETLGELTLAVRQGLRTRDLAGTTHAYPTYSDGVWNASVEDVRARLRRPATRTAITVLAAVRRGWLRRGRGSRLRRAAPR